MKKYSNRSLPYVVKESDNIDHSPVTPNWLSNYAKALQKISVEPIREISVYDQISSIMGRKSKHATVDDAVKDMKERSGLTAYLQTQSDGKLQSKASETVKLFEIVPQVKTTMDNCIEDSKGNLPIPAIIERVKSIHRFDVADDTVWDEDNLLKYINSKNILVKQNHPDMDNNHANLGRDLSMENFTDPSNTDAFQSLQPVTSSDYEIYIMSFKK